MTPVRYRTLGQYDLDDEVEVRADGRFRVSGGTYRSRGPRTGRLTPAQARRLETLLAAVSSRAHPVPDGAEGFRAELVVGEGPAQQVVTWWGPPPADDPVLHALLRVLRAL